MDRNRIGGWIAYHEDAKESVYIDSEGHPTIGIGFNLDRADAKDLVQSIGLDYDKILSSEQTLNKEQINYLFQHDLDVAVADAHKLFPNIDSYPEDKQLVLIDMSYNLGHPKLSGFDQMIKAVENNDWQKAADEMVDSHWYGQVGNRGTHDVNVMRNGFDSNSEKYDSQYGKQSWNEFEPNFQEDNHIELADNNSQNDEKVTLISLLTNDILHPQTPESVQVVESNPFVEGTVVEGNPFEISNIGEPTHSESIFNSFDDFAKNSNPVIDIETSLPYEQVDFIEPQHLNPTEIIASNTFVPVTQEPIEVIENSIWNTPFQPIDDLTVLSQPVFENLPSTEWGNDISLPTQPTNDIWTHDVITENPTVQTWDTPTNDIWANDNSTPNPIVQPWETASNDTWANDISTPSPTVQTWDTPTNDPWANDISTPSPTVQTWDTPTNDPWANDISTPSPIVQSWDTPTNDPWANDISTPSPTVQTWDTPTVTNDTPSTPTDNSSSSDNSSTSSSSSSD